LVAESPVDYIAVVDSKGKRSLTFPKKDFLLHHPTLSFEIENTTTYALLCYAGPLMIASQIEAAKRSQAIPENEFGPSRLS
jgi:hypothetical protein